VRWLGGDRRRIAAQQVIIGSARHRDALTGVHSTGIADSSKLHRSSFTDITRRNDQLHSVQTYELVVYQTVDIEDFPELFDTLCPAVRTRGVPNRRYQEILGTFLTPSVQSYEILVYQTVNINEFLELFDTLCPDVRTRGVPNRRYQ
jgi:hypothetical protein